jgi:hypothetical protein
MGGFQPWRTFLMNILWRHFYAQLPEGVPRRPHIIMVDHMQYLAPCVVNTKQPWLDTEYVARRIEEMTRHFLNNEQDPERPYAENVVVFMFDTVHNVPKNKAAKQRSRDANKTDESTTENKKKASKKEGESSEDDGEDDEEDEVPHMDEFLYEAMRRESPPLLDSLFTCNNPSSHLYTLTGLQHWRSYTLRAQLYRKLTLKLMHVPIKGKRVMIIDDGLAFSVSEYQRRREKLIKKEGFEKRSGFEKECLLAERMTRSRKYIQRFMVWPDGQYDAFPSTGIGEADIKIQAYINRESGVTRYLVVNQDTDIIFILLLHMATFLYHDERDDETEVWLDTRSPSDRSGENKPYRYIDIKRLYQGIVGLFRREYPHVYDPVSTFCFLVFSLETDFTRKFPSCLKITNALVWNTFSELHHYDFNPVTVPKDYIKFSQSQSVSPDKGALVRHSQRQWSPNLCGLLNDAVQYDCVKKRFYLKHDLLAQFFYLLCQVRVMTVRADIGVLAHPVVRRKQATMEALDPEELLIYAGEIIERLQYYKNNALKQSSIDAHMGPFKRLLTTATTDKEEKPTADKEEPTRVIKTPRHNEETKFATANDGWMRPNKSYHAPPNKKSEVSQLLDHIESESTKRAIVQVEEHVSSPFNTNTFNDTTLFDEPVVQRLRAFVNNAGKNGPKNTQLSLGYIQQNEKKLYDYTKAGMPPPLFGVPVMNDMLARMYREEWYLSYCCDGWRRAGPYGAVSSIEQASHDPALSVWGWQQVHHTDPAIVSKHLNSTYYIMHYDPKTRLFSLSEIVETDAVSHKRVYF